MDKKYIVDEIIDNIVKLEDCNTKQIININKKLLPSNIFDGAVVIKKDNNSKKEINKNVVSNQILQKKLKTETEKEEKTIEKNQPKNNVKGQNNNIQTSKTVKNNKQKGNNK